MRIRRSSLRWNQIVITLSLCFAASGVAETRLVMPGLARTAGVGGSRFESTAWLHNPADTSLEIDLSLVSSNGPTNLVRITLGPRETRRLDDPLLSLFGLDSGAGSLRARADGPFLLRGVTANVANPRGTYGVALTVLREADALRPGEMGVAPWLTHTAATETGFRTNLSVTLLEPETEAIVTIVDGSWLVRGEERVTGGPVFWQRSVGELVADPEIPLGRAEVKVIRGAAVAYAVVVDNVTSDGILSPARRVEAPAGPTFTLLVSGAARAPGANGTLWRTGLRLVNTGLTPVAATLQPAAGGPGVTRALPPRGILEETDLLGALGLPEGSAGSVRVTSSARLLGLASTRNVDPLGAPGTFAGALEPVDASAVTGTGRVLSFTGLSADSGNTGFRTNVAVVAGASGARGRMLLRAPSGAAMTESAFDLPASIWTQRPLAGWFDGAEVPRDAALEVTIEAGSLDAYASVIDNGTGDPVVLSPAALPVSVCPPSQAALLSSSAARVTAGTPVTLRLEAPGRGTGRVVPGDLPLGPGGSVAIIPAGTTTYRWLPPAGCPEDVSSPVTVEVVAPGGAVMTEGGAVSGVSSGGATSYRGIPFAAPPVGALRWRPPAPAESWSGARDGSAFGSICPQLDDAGKVTGTESCLFLNVWRPSAPSAKLLPVLFFIHGGGNSQGEGSLGIYDGTAFASARGAVVVTINYRLSAFGWLVQPFLSTENRRGVSGNYGTFDQLAALRWVKRNIAAFGGDPEKVTIFGESAGGVNVCTLTASPLAKGLFGAGIIQSGGCRRETAAEFETFGNTITRKSGCASSGDPAECLRAKPFDQILLAVPPVVSVTSSTGQLWGPSVDGFVLRDSPKTAMEKGEHNKVTVVVGSNADETGQAAPFISTEAEYRALITSQVGLLAPLVLAQYPASAYPTPRKAYVAVTTDARFVCPSRQYARAASKGGSRVYRYFFSYPANRLFGAIHAVELPFVFGSFGAIPGFSPDATTLNLSAQMNAAWGRIAAEGDPNAPGFPEWPVYNPVADRTLVWDATSAAVDGIRTQNCNFWDALTGGGRTGIFSIE